LEKLRLPDTPFWVEPESVGPRQLKLSLEESHHLLHVHRAKPGTPFQATDGAGGFFECVLESVERRAAVGRIVERREEEGELGLRIEILVGMPDRRALEQIVTGVPLGVSALDFCGLRSARTRIARQPPRAASAHRSGRAPNNPPEPPSHARRGRSRRMPRRLTGRSDSSLIRGKTFRPLSEKPPPESSLRLGLPEDSR
jgi:hypothetical protein